MKQFKLLGYTALLILSISFLQCKGAKENGAESKKVIMQSTPSFELREVSYQKWAAGVQGGGSGIHMYITIKTNKNNVVFDSLYFRGLSAKITIGKMGYYANLIIEKRKDIVMSGNPEDEYGNKPTTNNVKFPFDLEHDECVISYEEEGQIKYYKFNNLIEKEPLAYPSSSPN